MKSARKSWPYFVGGVLNLIPLLPVFTGCFYTDFQCTGDTMGGVMLLYSLTIGIPNLLGVIAFLFYFLNRSFIEQNQVLESRFSKFYVCSLIYLVLFFGIEGLWVAPAMNAYEQNRRESRGSILDKLERKWDPYERR